MEYINLNLQNIDDENICCAINSKKDLRGVEEKKKWLKEGLKENHVFRKLDERGKVFIEYDDLEKSLVPIIGENYIYIYCLWVSGKFKSQGHGKNLLNYCIEDAKKRNKSGICILSSKKKMPYLADRAFLEKYNFKIVDEIGDYYLMALSFDKTYPKFTESARIQSIDNNLLTIYHSRECPFIDNALEDIKIYLEEKDIGYSFILVDNIDMAKKLPCVFNNWAIFYKGEFLTHKIINGKSLGKLLDKFTY